MTVADLNKLLIDTVEPFMLPPRRAQAERVATRILWALSQNQQALDDWLEELAKREKKAKA